jgi:hypothetical protein
MCSSFCLHQSAGTLGYGWNLRHHDFWPNYMDLTQVCGHNTCDKIVVLSVYLVSMLLFLIGFAKFNVSIWLVGWLLVKKPQWSEVNTWGDVDRCEVYVNGKGGIGGNYFTSLYLYRICFCLYVCMYVCMYVSLKAVSAPLLFWYFRPL